MDRRRLLLIVGIGILVIAAMVGLIVFLRSRSVEELPPPVTKATSTTPSVPQAPTGDARTQALINAELERIAATPTDTDGDGLSDEEEAGLGTDPNKADTDGDGYGDAMEVRDIKTDPLKPDPRGADGRPVPGATPPVPPPPAPDTGGEDPDNDGLTNLQEDQYGTDPNNPDTDGDTYKDGDEVKAGYNPNGPGILSQ